MHEQGDLVRLLDLDKDFIIDLRYATPYNFTKQKVYRSGECYINKDTARLLIRAKNRFQQDGFRVKIWDAYRPISAQRRLFEILPNPDYVATPPDMSTLKTFRASHLNGQCVDLTLTDPQGLEISMPTPFDDFSELAGLACPHIPEIPRQNALYLRSIMEDSGFRSYSMEWWHFYDKVNAPAPFCDFPF